MTLLLLLGGFNGGGTTTVDTNDGITKWDAKRWKKQQKRLKDQQEKALSAQDEQRKEIRNTLNKIIYGEEEPAKLTEGIVEAQEALPADIPFEKLGQIAKRIEEANLNISAYQKEMVQRAIVALHEREANRLLEEQRVLEAKRRAEEAERLRIEKWKRDDEADVEFILSALANED